MNNIRQSVNLKTTIWDNEFDEIRCSSGTKFVRVLEQNCPHLVHAEGTIQRKFGFEIAPGKSPVCSASFLD